MPVETQGRWGGPRKGSGRKPQMEGAPRRNRVVVLVTDAEFAWLTRFAKRSAAPLGTVAYRLLAKGITSRAKS